MPPPKRFKGTAREFNLVLDQDAADIPESINTIKRALALHGLRGLVLKSPVGNPDRWKHPERAPAGYVGGTFRGNWQVTTTGQGSVTGSTDQAGGATISKGTGEALKAQPYQPIYISNHLSYSLKIEYGHSSVAPAGVLRLTFEEIVQAFDGIVRKNW